MRPTFSHMPTLQDNDPIAVVDSTQPVRDENASSSLFFEDTVNVLK